MEYDDLRFMLAVAETGSTLSAGKRLSVSQSTVSRRIVALERALGLEIFDKRPSGYVLTDCGMALLDRARAVRDAAYQFSLAAEALAREESGTVRFTTNEVMAGLFLAPLIGRLKRLHPGIKLEVDTTNALRDLKSGEADIALRAAPAPTQPDLFGSRLASDWWSLYCSRTYAQAHGFPRDIASLADHALIALDPHGRHNEVVGWAIRHFPPDAIVVRQNSIPAAFSSILGGVGVGFFSEILAAGREDLVLCFRPNLPPAAEVWLLTHEKLRNVPRVRIVMDAMRDLFQEHLGKLHQA
jgi:DNA-binding transcriptional LysR family regulator